MSIRTIFDFGAAVRFTPGFFAVFVLSVIGFTAQPAYAQRVLQVVNIAGAIGVESQVEAPIRLESPGGESVISFTLRYNPWVVADVKIMRGRDLPEDATLTINYADAAQGRLGVRLASASGLGVGARNILGLRFTILASASPGNYALSFTDSPVERNVLGLSGESLPVTHMTGNLTVGTADGTSVRGYVQTPSGYGVVGATVVVSEPSGVRRFATTSSRGYYLIPYIRLSGVHTFAVQSKRYRFAPQTVDVSYPFPEMNFTALE